MKSRVRKQQRGARRKMAGPIKLWTKPANGGIINTMINGSSEWWGVKVPYSLKLSVTGNVIQFVQNRELRSKLERKTKRRTKRKSGSSKVKFTRKTK